MIARALLWLLIQITRGGERDMLAVMLANRIIIGKLEYKAVPETLKPQVKEQLEDAGVGFLAEE